MLKIDANEFKNTKKILRKYNMIWRQFSGREFVGDCSFLYKKLRPVSYQDFLEKYTNDGKSNNSISNKKRGRTEQEIIELAKKYQGMANKDIPLEIYIMNVYTHVIIETYDGQRIEEYIEDSIKNNNNAIVKRCYGKYDAEYGIDMIVQVPDKKFALQVKPVSFFNGNNNESLIKDRAYAFIKEKKCFHNLNLHTYYMIYDIINDKSCRIYMNGDKKLFKLETLCNSNGIIKCNINESYNSNIMFYDN